jgi:hypothetical protein
MLQSQPRKIVFETLSILKKKFTKKKGWWSGSWLRV